MFARTHLVAAVSLSMLIAAGVVNAICARTYIVQPGDTCDGISAAKNVSTYQLAIVNSAKINTGCTNLFPGEALCLGNVGEDCTDVHVVVSGDVCSQIASDAGTDFETLFANNPNVDTGCTSMYVGEVLCVADQVFDYQ
ncbi:hypothetical protein C8J56DRAFT_864112 [Mycena floridula]|nr:hypothetical protein C8J56DRAFT_841854 [Mycena floridula]KAJ7583514.1 hypothetical protein C8J56DRAFT_864112 [Mycena floridula]